jgi:hypothetical protein
MSSPFGAFFGKFLFARLFVIGIAQQLQQLVNHRVITFFGLIKPTEPNNFAARIGD